MKARTKPIVVDAVQWFEGETHGVKLHNRLLDPYYAIHTEKGWLKVNPGYWIITGINGDKYPVTDEIFRETYEVDAVADVPARPESGERETRDG